MIDLKPCPCCGHRAELAEERCDYGDWYTIECVDCGLMIEGSDRQKLIDAWQRRRTDGMIRWLDAEIEKCDESRVSGLSIRRCALLQCKKQLLKLLDGMGNEGFGVSHCSPDDCEVRCPKCKSYSVKQVELTRAKCLECKHRAHVSMFRVKWQQGDKR